MQLGRGNVDFSKEFPLEGRERKAHPNAFKHRLIHEEEGFPFPGSVVHTHRFPWSAGTNGNVGIMGAVEGIKVIQMGITAVVLQVLEGCQGGAFAQEFVGGL